MPLIRLHYPENSGIYFNKGGKFLEYLHVLKLNFSLKNVLYNLSLYFIHKMYMDPHNFKSNNI
jgi:hypothetical protein